MWKRDLLEVTAQVNASGQHPSHTALRNTHPEISQIVTCGLTLWPGHNQMWIISSELQHKTVFQKVWELGAKSPTRPKCTSLQTPELRSSEVPMPLVRCHLPSCVPHFTGKRTELPISRTCSVGSEARTVK